MYRCAVAGSRSKNMLETRSPDPVALLEPTIELLSVLLIQSTDPVEREVSHIFINEYKTPGERNDWRSKVYSTLGDDLNVFTFPLEGTLNESPIVLSDLSEVLSRSKLYSGELVIGTLSHSELKTPQPIGLQAAALGGQGVTLGISGSGKTNTDCVLITEASKHLKRVIVANSIESHSIRDKQDAFSESTRKLIEYFKVKPGSGSAGIQVAVNQAFSRNGISVIEADKSMFQNMFDACITKVDASAGNVGNTPRVLEGMLLVEEANDAFGSDDARRKRVDNLERVLTKAWRKGWCIWLSTQHPSDVGYDNASVSRILRALQNRIFHQLDESDVALASSLLSDDDEAAKKFEVLLTHMKKWTAIVRGTFNDGGTIRPHPPITTAIRELGKELPKV